MAHAKPTRKHVCKNFSSNLRYAMDQFVPVYSVSDLARDLDVSQPLVSQWLSGKKLPSAVMLLELSDTLNTSIDFLLRGVC